MRLKKRIILAGLLFCCLVAGAQEKMNVLFIAVDDLKPALGCYGDPNAITPNIDALAKQGVVFNKNYCQQAVCGATRPSLLTGQRNDQIQIWGNDYKYREKCPDAVTLPQYFRQNGYYTAGVGKIWHESAMDKKQDSLSWDKYVLSSTYQYPAKYGDPAGPYQDPHTKARIKQLREEARNLGLQGNKVESYIESIISPPYECVDVEDEAYEDAQTAIEGIKLIQAAAKSKQPFFIAVGFRRPHLPFTAPKKYYDMHDPAKFKVAEFQEHAANSPEIAYNKNVCIARFRIENEPLMPDPKGKDKLINPEMQLRYIRGYYSATSFMDAQVGKVMQALKDNGLDKNTIVVFWGDHGWHLGDHGLWCKFTNFEQATFSPMIIIDPRAKKTGFTTNQMTEFVDIYPTLIDLAGIPAKEGLAGVSLRPVIYENKPVKEYSASQFPRKDHMGYTIRTPRYRYTVWMTNGAEFKKTFDKADVAYEELYDYEKDPLEKVSLQNDPAYKQVLEENRARFEQYFNNERFH